MKAKALLNLTLLLGVAVTGLIAGAVPAPTGSSLVLYNTGSGGSAAGCIGTATLSAGCTLGSNGSTAVTGWTVTTAPVGGSTTPQVVAGTTAPQAAPNPWLAQNTTSTWLSPSGTVDVNGDYRYELTFNMTAAQAASTAIITGQWAADDQASLLLNGEVASFIPRGVGAFTTWTPFTIDYGFQAGLNTLEIQVRNVSSQTSPGFPGAKAASGIRLEFASVFVPEGGEMAALTLGLGAVLFAWKRKKSALVPTL